MAIMLEKTYRALKAAKVPDETAAEAAMELAQRELVTRDILRADLAELKHDLLRWVVTLWAGQTLVLGGLIVAALFRH